ncbi:galactose mutarotase-like protein [Piedraia hortae CBS 480.64]|uniref:Galactose mutarotase-like protein n=1 Tax=Piedraia hortae CBS 480.64 TaxID=1314780 RepID=A0A6A7BTX6_9PEZI|nr:galactose mutarotase-like protein [Piedraia hortae CBS 480.64]
MWASAVTAAILLTQTAALDSKGPLPSGKYELVSQGIRAQFIPYGASLTNLFIRDVHGVERDVVLGYDNASFYSESAFHPHLNGVPGRYANRIKNGTFKIDGVEYHTDLNENGKDTLHGGRDGWDYRNWTVVAYSQDSITFSLTDPDGKEGFPGEVVANVTYFVTPYQWHLRMTAAALTKKTPLMLSSHTYWNLDGFQNPDTPLALDHTLHLPFAGLRTEVDSILIPTGNILHNEAGGLHDWWSSPKRLGANFSNPALAGQCGSGCTGYDNCYIFNRPPPQKPTPDAILSSPYSGIKVEVSTNQGAFQVYTCNNLQGGLALKETQGFFQDSSRPRVVKDHGCIVMEVQDWIDGINHPEWGRKQIYGPGDEQYVLEARYEFSLMGKKGGT